MGAELGDISLAELQQVINKLERRKSTGPDAIPMELFKEMGEENQRKVLEMLNTWWNTEAIPHENLMARVVLI